LFFFLKFSEFQTGNNAFIIFTHPNGSNSFTAAMKDAILEGLSVILFLKD
jgi:hypothetical protein